MIVPEELKIGTWLKIFLRWNCIGCGRDCYATAGEMRMMEYPVCETCGEELADGFVDVVGKEVPEPPEPPKLEMYAEKLEAASDVLGEFLSRPGGILDPENLKKKEPADD